MAKRLGRWERRKGKFVARAKQGKPECGEFSRGWGLRPLAGRQLDEWTAMLDRNGIVHAQPRRCDEVHSAVVAALDGGPSLRRGQVHWVLGRREWVRLPDWGGVVVAAKVDTGARTSSLHAEDLELFQRGEEPWVRFRPVAGDAAPREAPVCALRTVVSSNGEAELRPFVRAPVEIGPVRFETLLNLTQREQLRYPMLLGRSLLNGVFLVDPQRTGLAGLPRTEAR